MSAPQVCTNDAGESVPCANLLLNKFGLPVFDMTRVLHRERPCFNNDGDRVACYQPGNGESGLRAHVSDEGWCKADADCYSGNCCENYCKSQSWNCVGGIHQGPTTEAPHHIEILQEGDDCNATMYTETLPSEINYFDLEPHTVSKTTMCSQHPYPLLCHKPDGPDKIGTCRECNWSDDCQDGYGCMDHEGQKRICLPENLKCSATKKCHHGLICGWSGKCVTPGIFSG